MTTQYFFVFRSMICLRGLHETEIKKDRKSQEDWRLQLHISPVLLAFLYHRQKVYYFCSNVSPYLLSAISVTEI